MSRDMQMQKGTEKNPYGKFLPENLGLILLAPMFLMLLFTVSILYQLESECIFYITSLFLILWGIAVCVQYRMLCKKVRQQEKELEEAQDSKREESLRWQKLQEKQDFFALWAHQIKTPIAALNLLLQEEKQDTGCAARSFSKLRAMWRWR